MENKLNEIIKDNDVKNFITKSNKNDDNTFKITQHVVDKIRKRRDNQYIAGEIIAVFSLTNIKKSNLLINFKSRIESKNYFLVLSSNFESSYLLCPLFFKPILSCPKFNDYEISLGIVSELSESKMVYADLSRCHYINKDEFHNHISAQGELLRKEGKENAVYMLDKLKFKSVIKRLKYLISS